MDLTPVPLHSVAEVIRGVTFPRAHARNDAAPGFVPILRAGNIQDGLIVQEDLLYVAESLVNERQLLRHDDIVMCTSSGSSDVVGKTARIHGNYQASFGAFCAVLRANRCNPAYLFHYLRSPAFRSWTRKSAGANIKNIRKSEMEAFQIPLPSAPEQKRIADILDKADAIRRARQSVAAMADQFLRSIFLEMFGDPLENPNGFPSAPISSHLSRTRDGAQSGPFGSALKKNEYVELGVPVWGVENVQTRRFVDKPTLFITDEKFVDLRRYAVVPGDVLISRAGTVGRMCVARPPVEKSIISTNLIRVSLEQDSLLPEYFVSLFTYVGKRLGSLRANDKKAAFTFLNPKTIRRMEIPIPPIQLQREYESLAHKIDQQVAQSVKQTEGLRELFESLSQSAFHGRL